MKHKILFSIAALIMSFSAVAQADTVKNLSSDEYMMFREVVLVNQCYSINRASDTELNAPLTRLYMARLDVGKALIKDDMFYITRVMNRVQYEDWARIQTQVMNNPGYYCSKYSK